VCGGTLVHYEQTVWLSCDGAWTGPVGTLVHYKQTVRLSCDEAWAGPVGTLVHYEQTVRLSCDGAWAGPVRRVSSPRTRAPRTRHGGHSEHALEPGAYTRPLFSST